MLIYLFPILALIASPATIILTGWHHAIGIPLFIGYLIGLWVAFFLTIFAIAPLLSKKKKLTRPNPIARFFVVEAYSIAILFMQVHVKVTGREKLPKRGTTFLVVSNHLSNYDHMIMLTRLRRFSVAFISKPENFNIPIVGRYLYHAGFLAIDRRSARNALTTVNETAHRIGECGMCYGVFPEGTRSRTGKLLPFHSGVFLSAKKAEAPILVVHMTDTDRVPHRAPWLPTRVRMDILACLDRDYVISHTDKEISEYTYELMLTTGQEPYRKPEAAAESKAPVPQEADTTATT